MGEYEDSIRIVKEHRECFPDPGERMVLASEAECKKILQQRNEAIKEKAKAVAQLGKAQAETRAWQVITVWAGVVGIVVGFVTGILV